MKILVVSPEIDRLRTALLTLSIAIQDMIDTEADVVTFSSSVRVKYMLDEIVDAMKAANVGNRSIQ